MTCQLATICPAPVFGVPVYLCTCGHRAYTINAHHTHLAEATA